MQLRFNAIGTSWEIDLPNQHAVDSHQDDVNREISAIVDYYDRTYSRFRPDSLVRRLESQPGSIELPDDAEPLLRLYRQFYDLTDGLVTPLIGSTLAEAGYDANYSLRPQANLHSPPRWEDAIEYRAPVLTASQPVVLDLGAAGKGYLIDLLGAYLSGCGYETFTIDAGGDILHQGKPTQPISVGMEHPHDFATVIGVASIANQSICASSGNRRAWHNFHHIMNPKTLTSPTATSSVWVVAPTAALADIIATSLFFVSPQQLLADVQFEYALLCHDQNITYSPGFPAEFFTALP